MEAQLFFLFLSAASRMENIKMLELSRVAAYPHMDEGTAKKISGVWIKSLEDPLEKFENKSDYSGIEKLAKGLGG